MLRIGTVFLLWFVCGKTLAGIDVELDVVFNALTVQCRYLYVLCADTKKTTDTLAIFDSLSFNRQNRVSLFYSASSTGENMLSMVDAEGTHVTSEPFNVSHLQTVFTVAVDRQHISVTGKNFLYPLKNEDKSSFFVFLLIFFTVKILIATISIFISKLPKRIIPIAAGAFLLSVFIDWFFPFNYLYRFLIAMLIEYLIIALVGRKSISWLRAALLVVVVNMAGYGIIALLYIFYVFW